MAKKVIAIIAAIVILIGILIIINSIDTCKNISDYKERDACYTDVAEQKRDPSICYTKVSGYTSVQDCFKKVAVLEKDVNLCESGVFLGGSINWCYRSLAEATKDADVCNRIRDFNTPPTDELNNICFLAVAYLKQDSSICERITDEETLNRCHDFLDSGNPRFVCEQYITPYNRETCYAIYFIRT